MGKSVSRESAASQRTVARPALERSLHGGLPRRPFCRAAPMSLEATHERREVPGLALGAADLVRVRVLRVRVIRVIITVGLRLGLGLGLGSVLGSGFAFGWSRARGGGGGC